MLTTPLGHAYPYHIGAALIVLVAAAILGFTFTQRSYQRFYLPTSFLSMFLLCVISLLIFSLPTTPLIRCVTFRHNKLKRYRCSPLGCFITSVEVVLLLYTVIPLPLYMCVLTGAVYTILYEVCDMYLSCLHPTLIRC